MSCNYCVEFCPFDAIKMNHDYELAAYERYPHLIYDKTELTVPLDYYAALWPVQFKEEQIQRAKKAEEERAKEAEKARRAQAKAQAAESAAENSAAETAAPMSRAEELKQKAIERARQRAARQGK